MSRATRAPLFARRPAVLLLGLALGFGMGLVRAEADPQARKLGDIPLHGTCIRNLECRVADALINGD